MQAGTHHCLLALCAQVSCSVLAFIAGWVDGAILLGLFGLFISNHTGACAGIRPYGSTSDGSHSLSTALPACAILQATSSSPWLSCRGERLEAF